MNSSNFIVRFLFLILSILIIVAFIRTITGSVAVPTFTSFLNMLQEVPEVDIAWELPFLNEEWEVLDFIREAFAFAFSVGKFILDSIGSVFTFIFYIVRWAFVGGVA